jgi:hypothetical protein
MRPDPLIGGRWTRFRAIPANSVRMTHNRSFLHLEHNFPALLCYPQRFCQKNCPKTSRERGDSSPLLCHNDPHQAGKKVKKGHTSGSLEGVDFVVLGCRVNLAPGESPGAKWFKMVYRGLNTVR